MASIDLSVLGIDPIEPNSCEDTPENRRALRNAQVPYRSFQIGVLEVDMEVLKKTSNPTVYQTQYEKYKILLTDPDDPFSDYLSPNDLPLDYWEGSAPPWLKQKVYEYRDAVASSARKIPNLPKRCTRIRTDGRRCFGWTWPTPQNWEFCRGHMPPAAFDSSAVTAVKQAAAQYRLIQLTDTALDALEELVESTDAPQVRMRAAEAILDRAGHKPGTKIELSGEVAHTESVSVEIKQRLAALAAARNSQELKSAADTDTDEVLDAEVVEESE